MSYGGLQPGRLTATITAREPSSLILVPELLRVLVPAAVMGWKPPASLRFVAVGAQGGLDALGRATQSRDRLEAALKINPKALQGAAYTSLGALYHKVPGSPVGFGSDKKAKEHLEQALAINPAGIDPNYFYGEFLYDEDDYAGARRHLEKALQATPRPNRQSADEGRRRDIDALLMKLPARQPVFNRTFWLRHAVWPALLFALFATAAATTDLDETLARSWDFDPATSHFIGSGPGQWWAKDLIHGAGGRLIRILGGAVLLLWCLSFWFETLRGWRRPAGFVVLCAVLGAGAVGLLKETTNVDCPWALADFGGQEPYVRLFADRPDALPRARCFPGGHSSSGFALFTLYFLCLRRSQRGTRWGLAAALLVGGVFAFGQEARGAHFLAHDVWSAALVWFACLAVYTLGYGGAVWEPREDPTARV